MKHTINYLFLFFIFPLMFIACQTAQNSNYRFTDVSFNQVHFTDQFWASRIDTIRKVTVPYAFKMCEQTGRVNNFAVAGGLVEGKSSGDYPFDDSDIYKIIEGAAFLLSGTPDKALDAYIDSLITLIAAAQEPDGYLYTNRTINNPPHPWIGDQRWVNEWNLSHETYNMGHMYEAAVAHYQATGKRNFLDIAIRNADLMCATFNPQGLDVAPGHQVIEMGLVKLYRVTGNKEYLELSRFFCEARGKSTRFDSTSNDMWINGEYWQDHLPVVKQKEAVGHAVRALYLYSGMADIAALMDDRDYLSAIDTLWSDITHYKTYITGGIGAQGHGEAFGPRYVLPAATAYCETCAAIANCMFNHRMFMLHGDAKYIDVLERSLYNGVLSGIEMSGDKFFYPNRLSVGTSGEGRSAWFSCSCCPSNLARFIPSVPGYAYATDKSSLYVNLFVEGDARTQVNGTEVLVQQVTTYPWDGKVVIAISPLKKERFDLRIRIPGWSQNSPMDGDLYHYANTRTNPLTISVNGKPFSYKIENGYAVLSKKWEGKEVVSFDFNMVPRQVLANRNVVDCRNKTAIEYGPIVYCAEFADNGGSVSNLVLPLHTSLSVSFDSDQLNGVNLLQGEGIRVLTDPKTKQVTQEPTLITFIPYYARSHRGLGEMDVWLMQDASSIINSLVDELNIIDKVVIGDAFSEKQHNLQGKETFSPGANQWRHATEGGWFSYDMVVDSKSSMAVVFTYSSLDGGNRRFDILVDGTKIAEQQLRTETFNEMIERSYPIPSELIQNKKRVTVTLKAHPGHIAGGIFGCRTERVENK